MMNPDYDDWDEPILENGYKRANQKCKFLAQKYSKPGYPVEHIGTERIDQPDGATTLQPNWRCNFRSPRPGIDGNG